jgi:hypothetical protein
MAWYSPWIHWSPGSSKSTVGIYWLGAQLPGRALEVWEIAMERPSIPKLSPKRGHHGHEKFIKPQKNDHERLQLLKVAHLPFSLRSPLGSTLVTVSLYQMRGIRRGR